MLKIGTKQKRLLFEVTTKGIQAKDLEFWLRIFTEKCSLGFRGELLESGKVLVKVPPIDEILTEVDSSKNYKAQVEIIGEGKFFMKTWEGEVVLEKTPEVEITLEAVTEETSKKKRLVENTEVEDEILKDELGEEEGLEDDDELPDGLKEHDDELVENGILSESSTKDRKKLFEGRTLGPQALLNQVLGLNKK